MNPPRVRAGCCACSGADGGRGLAGQHQSITGARQATPQPIDRAGVGGVARCVGRRPHAGPPYLECSAHDRRNRGMLRQSKVAQPQLGFFNDNFFFTPGGSKEEVAAVTSFLILINEAAHPR